jgi:two-component system, LytTR family, response regulator
MNEQDEPAKILSEMSPPWAQNAKPAAAISHRPARESSSSGPQAGPADRSKEMMQGRIAITSRRKIVFVNLADVVAVEARCNYVVLRSPCGAYRLRQPISSVAEYFEHYGFLRIHRSTIVNGRFVEEIRSSISGKMFVQLKGLASGYHVSRKYRSSLRLFASGCTYQT